VDGTETHDGLRPRERTAEDGLRFARRMYLPRALGLGVGTLAVGGGLWEAQAPHWAWLLLALNGFVWPHLAYRIAKRSRDPHRAELHNLVFDSACGGAWVAAIGFNLVPSAVLVAMLAMDKAAVGGVRFLARCLNGQIATGALVALVNNFWLHLDSGFIAVVASLPLLLAYPPTVGYNAYRLARRVRQQNDVLAALSTIDGLTRLMNRVHWEQAVATEFQRCRRIGHSSAVLMLDIDHFKAVNDVHGHQVGDAALRAVAAMLRDSLRMHDIAGRYGGEEFGVVLPGIDASGAAAIAERIRRKIESSIVEARRGVRVTASIGYAALGNGDHDPGAWIARADRALYAAKAAGRNCAIGQEIGDGARILKSGSGTH
jgi:diguanylate cyclase